jgi:type IV secretory pathway VirB2 component (pilin)
MSKQMIATLYVAVMIATIIGVDVLFFRDYFRERLMVNIGIVLVFGACYLRFFRGAW